MLDEPEILMRNFFELFEGKILFYVVIDWYEPFLP